MMPVQTVAQAGQSGTSAGKAARFASCLCQAASPTFAVMALICAIAGNTDPICSATHGTFAFGGMSTMYWLMSVFHLPAWLNKLRHRW